MEDVNLLPNNLNDNKANVPFIPQQPEPKQTKETSSQIQVVPMHVQIQNSTRVMDSPIPENTVVPHSQFVHQIQKSQFKSTAPQLDSAGTQKTAEKMRRDEGRVI